MNTLMKCYNRMGNHGYINKISMTKAEEQSLKAYPKVINGNGWNEWDENEKYRQGYVKGYNQAEKNVIERTIEWLEYAKSNKMSLDGAIAYFKAIMEEEK